MAKTENLTSSYQIRKILPDMDSHEDQQEKSYFDASKFTTFKISTTNTDFSDPDILN